MFSRHLSVGLAAWGMAVAAAPVLAQQPPVRLRVQVLSADGPVADARVVGDGRTMTVDDDGWVELEVPVGLVELVVESPRYLPTRVRVTVAAGERAALTVTLVPLPTVEEEIVVTATRTGTRLQDQPVRVEVIDREEIEEKALMTPGSVAMLLSETTGLRVQTTAPSLGAANVRIQGLNGRYSQLLADGLPLYGAGGNSLSMLQVPPLDLGQVEVIKGVASALYGSSALGGVINLVSRRPREDEYELLVNRTSQAGTDAIVWVARAPVAGWSWTLLGGYNAQERQDVDEDGWTDVPQFERGVLRPRVVYEDGRGTSVFATLGLMAEDRQGGTVPGGTAPDGGPFLEAVDSRRVDGGFVGRWLVGSRILSVRGSAGRQSQDRRFGVARERGVRTTWFSEVSLRGARGRHAWVAGSAFQQDQLSVQELPRFDYRFAAPAVFAQDDVALGSRMTLAVSARADLHSEYGALVTPRVSLLARPAPEWTIRVAGGTGAFTPTPFTDETDETGLGRLRPLRGLRAERARGAALDVTRTFGPLEVTGTVFGSVVHHPLQQRIVSETQVELVNADGPTRTRGTELLVRYRGSGFVVLATHAWTRATDVDPDRGDRRDVPLTPAHSGSLNVMWEGEDWGRAGIEVYYTGRQSLDENPYRARGRPYTLLGALAERRWGAARFFINVENLFDTRQTSFDLLTRPVRRPDGRWTVDAWAPLEGRVVNGGVRVGF